MPLYGSCPEPMSAAQPAHSNGERERREGWELQTWPTRNREGRGKTKARLRLLGTSRLGWFTTGALLKSQVGS